MAVASRSSLKEPSRLAAVTPSVLALATLVPGTLDILSAFLFAGIDGIDPGRVLRFIASGPLGDGMRQGALGAAALGLVTHYILMTVMAAVFIVAAVRLPLLRRSWLGAGIAYGLAIYVVMYWVVLPARFGPSPAPTAWAVANALFSHIACVGIPMAWIVRRGMLPKWERRS